MRIWQALTTRGRFFVIAGLVMLAVGLALMSRDVLRIALLMLIAPAAALVLVLGLSPDLRLRRVVRPERVPIDGTATVSVQIINPGRVGTRLLLAEEEAAPGLGARPRFALDRLPAGDSVTVSYRVQPARRGVYALGPMSFRVTDGLGLCEAHLPYPGTDRLLALPVLHRLSRSVAGQAQQGSLESHRFSVSAGGEYDVSARQFRHGDDLRRVHWRTTARRGELMVRREEPSDERQASVLLDARGIAHRGEGTESSLEWAISAAASVCEYLSDSGFAVRLVLDGTDPGWTEPVERRGRERLLERLAVLQALGPRALSDAIEVVAQESAAHVVVAVLGEVDPETAGRLGRHSGGIALLLDAARWDDLPAVLGERLSVGLVEASGRLQQAGWSTARYHRAITVPDAWEAATAEAAAAR